VVCPLSAAADSNHSLFFVAVNRITSNAVKTIQPYGYGKAPLKNAHNVAMSKTIKSPEIQSGLIFAPPLGRNLDCGNSIPVLPIKNAIRKSVTISAATSLAVEACRQALAAVIQRINVAVSSLI